MSAAAGPREPGRVAIMMALPEEASPLLARLQRRQGRLVATASGVLKRTQGQLVAEDGLPMLDPAVDVPDRLQAWRGYLGSRPVIVQIAGPGPGRAARAAQQVLHSVQPAAVLCAGLAGALGPSLRRGDIVLATRVVERDGGDGFDADPGLLEAASKIAVSSRVLRDVVVTSARVVGTAAEKASLASQGGAVDMESVAVARVAAHMKVPFLAVRIISDAADEDFPIDLNQYIDEKGNVKRLQLALAALGRPTNLSFLLRLRRAAKEASGMLASYLESFLNACDFESIRRPT